MKDARETRFTCLAIMLDPGKSAETYATHVGTTDTCALYTNADDHT
jgi:hypothetical protein